MRYALLIFAARLHPFVFSFDHTATPEIYTLSLHDALPICVVGQAVGGQGPRHHQAEGVGSPPGGVLLVAGDHVARAHRPAPLDRKSTRLNSSHVSISYAVFCLKKKNLLLRS